MKQISINITGDFAIYEEYTLKAIDPALLNMFKKNDLNIINLESPITEATRKDKIIKNGPHLKGDPDATKFILKELNTDLVTLANNHILDYGEKGLSDTLFFCESNGIDSVGAGKNRSEAMEIYRKKISGYEISVINFAENEYGNATNSSGGANPMDIIDNVKQILDAKKSSDFLFVIVHGGHINYNFPSPEMQKRYRYYAENGANLIIGHHPHCISGYEIYNKVPIYYSLGNFLFTKPNEHKDWSLGLILEIIINEKKELNTKIHPVQQDAENFSLKLLEGIEKKKVDERISTYNSIIGNEQKLQKKWNIYINEQSRNYLNYFSPLSFIKNKYIRAGLRKLGLGRINKSGAALLLNLIRCESHADLSKEVLTGFLKKK